MRGLGSLLKTASLVLVTGGSLLVGSGAASAQPAPMTVSAPATTPPTTATRVTDAAVANLTRMTAQLGRATSARVALAAQYDGQLRGIDGLKRERASWTRDRKLRDALATSLETAKQLTVAARTVDDAARAVTLARGTLDEAVVAELRQTGAGPRLADLQKMRRSSAPVGPGKKIVLPDAELDPLADPEELDEQAQSLRASEAELAQQVDKLTQQVERLAALAELRRQHTRAEQLARRDDDQPRRGVPTTSRSDGVGGNETVGTPTTGDTTSTDAGHGIGDPQGGGGRDDLDEAATRFVLAEVVDGPTLDALEKARRTGDPAQRASAAKRTRDAVAARLKQLRDRRVSIEQRAGQLRR